ncbi:MAG: glycosyltransferase family 39 protein [Candidatus Obscuribacterales bacterium]|nr:glycosyltransferase family 39 protein [Candidatus Obscuribacterales bacterium]
MMLQTASRQTTIKAPEKHGQLKDWSWIIAIALYVAVNLLLISPEGNFPLDDDWVYGFGVKSLLEHGRIEMPTSFSTAFVHVGIGALVCKLFGYSYTVLHWSTAILGIVATAALYLAMREVGVRRNIAGFATFLFASNPMIVHLVFSFLSDLPSFAFTNLYLLFLLRGIRRNSLTDYAISSVMLAGAAGARQGSLLYVVPNMVVILFALLRQGLTKKTLLLFVLLVVFPVGWTIGLESKLEHGATKCVEYTNFKQAHVKFFTDMLRTPFKWLFAMTVALGQVACYFALYCLPLLVLFVPKVFNLARQRFSLLPVWLTVAAATLSTALTKLVVADGRLMPFSMNIFRLPEIGAHNLMGITLPPLSKSCRMWLTHISGVFAFLFLVVLGSALERTVILLKRSLAGNKSSYKDRRATMIAFVTAAGLVCLGCVCMETVILDLDRHYMVALAPLLIVLAVACRWWKIPSPGFVSCLLLGVIALYSTLATQDYMSWNRARWQAIGRLEAQGIAANVIDGGPEYVFPRDPNLDLELWRGSPRKSIRDYWRWWRVHDDQYIVSFSPVPGYEEIGRVNYFSGLAFGDRAVLMLKRVVPDKPFIDPALAAPKS